MNDYVQSCVSHTDFQPMKYLVWLDAMHGPAAQLWAIDYTINPNNMKPKENYPVIKKIELKGTEQYMSLKSLMVCYPCPDQEPGAC